MKFLVTGADGYIGRHVVTALLELGHNVTVSVRPGKAYERQGVTAIAGNILATDDGIFERMGRPDVCIHLAWEQGFVHNSPAHLLNVPRHLSFVRDMLQGGLKHIVGIGTAHEIGPYLGAVHEDLPTSPAHPYGAAKDFLRRAQGFYAQEAGAHSQWLRCFYIVGDDRRNNSIFRKLLDAADRKEDTFPLNDGEILFDFIHVAELARQIARVSSQTAVTGIINCCTGKPETLKSRVTSFIKEQGLAIKPEWGAFPLRPYETRGIWGDRKRLDAALAAMRI